MDQNGKSFASFLLLAILQAVQVQAGAGTKNIDVHAVTATPPLSVQGYNGQRVTFQAVGYTFQNGDTFSFPDGGITVQNIQVSGDKISGTISTGSGAATGSRPVDFSVPDPKNPGQRRVVRVADAFTVYRGATPSLIDLLNRPAPGARQQFPGQRGGNPRTQEQQTRIDNILAATTRAQITQAWNTWTRTDTSLTAHRISAMDDVQLGVLCSAAAQIEDNTHQVHIGAAQDPQPPGVPESMWRALLVFMSSEEGGGNALPMAGVAAENSYGIMQFNDSRASGNNFTGSAGQSVPIYRPGIIADWKNYFLGAPHTLQQLTQRVTNLGSGDWRADPYASMIDFIRSSQAHYAHLMVVPQGTTIYEAGKDFRVDLIPPQRANGQGSQRDVYEFFSVVHRLPADAFGGSFDRITYAGGVTTSTTPYSWNTSGRNAANVPYMTADGTTRAEHARTNYDANAPQGGFQ